MNYLTNIKFIAKIILMVFILSISCQANFSYTIKNPTAYDAKKYITYKSNISILTESSGTAFWHPNIGSSNANSTTPGVIIYHFPLTEPIEEAILFVRTDTYHWNYSRGYSLIFISTDGYNWDKIKETLPPKFGKWNAGNFSASLPSKFIGEKDIYVKIMLYSYGSKAFRGGIMTNTAQHLRYDPSHDNITFKLDVKSQIYSDQYNNPNLINKERTKNSVKGDCYVGCKPSSGNYSSCAISCGNDIDNVASVLSNDSMTSIVTGPTSWEECASFMNKLEIEGW